MTLLDTHALVWMDAEDPQLGPAGRALIVATALHIGATVVTADARLLEGMPGLRAVQARR